MPIFMINAHVTVSAYAHVEADTAEEAVEKARTLPVGFGFYNADPAEGFVIEDCDGEPENIESVGEVSDD